MQLISVNLGEEREIQNAKFSERTGIYKLPCEKPVLVTRTGLVDDVIYDIENHGGVDQAIYIYGMTDYNWWSQELGQTLSPGTFGDNLTISELASAEFSIGDRLQVGPVLLEVTAPRIPCVTLAARMNDPFFVKRFRFAERPGLYCRVIEEGTVQAGLTVTRTPYGGTPVTIAEMFRNYYEPDNREETIRRYLDAPLAIRARRDYEEKLEKLLAQK